MSRVLGTRFLRLVFIAMLILWSMSAVSNVPRFARHLDLYFVHLPSGLYDVIEFLIPVILFATIAIASLLLLALLGFGRILTQSLIPAAQASLGVATGVPPWAGTAADDPVVVLHTPHVDTFSFDLRDPDPTLAAARKDTTARLREILNEPGTREKTLDQKQGIKSPPITKLIRPIRVIAWCYFAIAVGYISYAITSQDRSWPVFFYIAVTAILGGFIIRWGADRARYRGFDLPPPIKYKGAWLGAFVVLGILSLVILIGVPRDAKDSFGQSLTSHGRYAAIATVTSFAPASGAKPTVTAPSCAPPTERKFYLDTEGAYWYTFEGQLIHGDTRECGILRTSLRLLPGERVGVTPGEITLARGVPSGQFWVVTNDRYKGQQYGLLYGIGTVLIASAGFCLYSAIALRRRITLARSG